MKGIEKLDEVEEEEEMMNKLDEVVVEDVVEVEKVEQEQLVA